MNISLKNKFSINFAKNVLISSRTLRNITMKQYEKRLYNSVIGDETFPLCSKNVKMVKYHGGLALANSLLRNYDDKYISRKTANTLIDTVLQAAISPGNKRRQIKEAYQKRHGIEPPFLITISPTNRCNLYCKGCYASSKAASTETLDWQTLDKIIVEAHDEMGMRFFTISGGEPLTYQSEGKTILDLARKWRDCFFLMYTNGTLIDEKMAREIADLGNLTPSISVEGFAEHTDDRRGTGSYQKILAAMSNLRDAGVIFGASATATKNNADVLLDDSFYSFYFEKMRVTYMWIFQYMPIGRNYTTELMLTPEQRFELFKKWREVLIKKRWFVVDFWNSGIIPNGCLSAAKQGGYFYIDWNGNIMPCVFVPYYKDNVKDLYKQGKNIQDALFSDFFCKIREWQNSYFDNNGKQGNMLTPCFIRDHHREFLKIARDECKVLPEDIAAAEAMNDPAYHHTLIEFDEKLKAIEDPCWACEYLGK